MALTDKLNDSMDKLQSGAKNTTLSLFTTFFKIISSFFIGLLFALIFKEVFQYGNLLFLFALLMSGYVFFRLVKDFPLMKMVLTDLFIILICVSLKMYIMIAPN